MKGRAAADIRSEEVRGTDREPAKWKSGGGLGYGED